jgi:hypothetical protein
MNKYYKWKELTNDGRLVEPKEYGPYYDTFRLSEGPFRTEEDAVKELEEFYKKLEKDYEDCAPITNYVLITIYSNSDWLW